MSSPTVFVHVGAPKTGTTYLQDLLSRNTSALADAGVLFPDRLHPGDAAFFHFQAALDLLGQDWGGPPGHAERAWPAMVRKVQRGSGAVVISHEILANARNRHIARLRSDLDEAEVHVVYTARDLARQLPAAWQESIKQGRTWSYARFLARARGNKTWFMKAFDLPRVLGRWSVDLPPEHVHVITVPQAGAPKDELWHRFCRVIGVDPSTATQEAVRLNQSMGIEQVQVLRELNNVLARKGGKGAARRGGGDLDQVVMGMIEQGVFAGGRRPITLPPELHGWAVEQTDGWIEWIGAQGVDVVGDLDELRPVAPDPDVAWHDPDQPRKGRMTRIAVDALAEFAAEAARREVPTEPLAPRVRRTISRWASS